MVAGNGSDLVVFARKLVGFRTGRVVRYGYHIIWFPNFRFISVLSKYIKNCTRGTGCFILAMRGLVMKTGMVNNYSGLHFA